jgi:hypothetical protein
LCVALLGCGGEVAIPASTADGGDVATSDDGATSIDASPDATPSVCAQCLADYFTDCRACTCAETDAGPLIECVECPSEAGAVYGAAYGCELPGH